MGQHAKASCQPDAGNAVLEVGVMQFEGAIAIKDVVDAGEFTEVVVYTHYGNHQLLVFIDC